MTQPTKEFLEQLIGLPEPEARLLCKENEFLLRVSSQDGKHFIVTMDLRFDRINVHIDNGIITKADIG